VLDIVIDDGLSDIVAGRFDAGIRVGERLEKDMVAVRLTPDVKMRALASPDYLSRRGEPRRLATSTAMLASTGAFPAAAGSIAGSSRKKSKKLEMAVEGPLVSNHQDVVIEGALQGSAFSTPMTTIALMWRRARTAKAHPG